MHFDLLSGLTKAQLEAFYELRRKVGNEMTEQDRNDDSIFLRFLRAREYNIDRSETMLRNHVQWKKNNKIDTIMEDYKPPEVSKYFQFPRFGCGKNGNPVRLLEFPSVDFKGILKSVTKDVSVQHVLSLLESDLIFMKQQSRKFGKHIETWIFILDFDNFTFAQATHKPTLELIGAILQLYEANYPERLKQVFIINASIYFTLLFAVVKPLLTGNTVSKINIFGKTGYQEVLREIIDPAALPKYLGGDLVDPDGNPRCPSLVTPCGKVPEKYYFRSPERRLSTQPGVKKYHVSRMSKINIDLDVPEPGSFIEWEFETENRDIGFGLYYRDEPETKPKELIPKQRFEAHLRSEAGMYKCSDAGTYILLFDNSYSWMSQKEIFCRVGVVTPKDNF